jgi:fumarate reductase subunit D
MSQGSGPLLFLIIALGAIRPTTWLLFVAGSIAAVALATILTLIIPRLYPWGSEALPA